MNELLNDLDRRGFSDELLAEEINTFSAYHLPLFSLKRERKIDGEQMEYRLVFHWNDPDMKYELRAIEVLHRMRVKIEPGTYLGIDIISLDKKMALVDWEQFWKSNSQDQKMSGFSHHADSIMRSLSELLREGSSEVQDIAEDLMYKYFPSEIFSIFSPKPERHKQIYEHNFTYRLEHYPQISAELAYLFITERTDSLASQLEEFMPEQVSDSEIRNEIYNKLKNNPDEALLNFEWVTQDGTVVEMNVPVDKKDNWLHAIQYQLIVSQLPELPKGVLNSVDAELLAKRMALIDWKNDEDLVFANSKGDIAYTREAELIQEELFRMAWDPDGKKAADLLMLRYFHTVPFFEDQISAEAYGLLENLQKRVVYLTSETSVDEALNMIKGRPVLIKGIPDHIDENWLSLKFSEPDKAGELTPLKGITPKELEKMIAIIPVENNNIPGIVEGLMAGERIETTSKSGVPITIMMTANADRVMICDPNGMEIPFNFDLDPDWRPELGTAIKDRQSKDKKQAIKQVKGKSPKR